MDTLENMATCDNLAVTTAWTVVAARARLAFRSVEILATRRYLVMEGWRFITP